jgi:hypothetical protein
MRWRSLPQIPEDVTRISSPSPSGISLSMTETEPWCDTTARICALYLLCNVVRYGVGVGGVVVVVVLDVVVLVVEVVVEVVVVDASTTCVPNVLSAFTVKEALVL